MLLLLLATACAGLFCGAALYINVVEHPARMSCGQELAMREFAPSYHRATILQVTLAIGGFVSGLAAAWQLGDATVAAGAFLLGASVPFTLIFIFPTNKQLLDPALDPRSVRAASLLRRWNRLHAVRTILSAAAFGLLLWSVASHGRSSSHGSSTSIESQRSSLNAGIPGLASSLQLPLAGSYQGTTSVFAEKVQGGTRQVSGHGFSRAVRLQKADRDLDVAP